MEEENGDAEGERLKHFGEASRISKIVRKYAEETAKKERSLLAIAEKIEAKIKEEKGGLAFPVNLSVNQQAAHYTPEAGDKATIGDKDVLKVDFGVEIEGFIIDQAFSVDYGHENGKLVEATKMALENALSIMKAGVSTRDVGKEIEKTIKSYGFKPVENLCGHSLEQYDLHAGIEVPNVESGGYVFEEGDSFAVEPFASNGKGHVVEGDYCQIYALEKSAKMQVRLPRSRQLLTEILEKSVTMPFALRWFKDFQMLNLAVNDLSRQGILKAYPVLVEAQKGALVSQAETSVIIEKEGVKVLA